MDGPGYLPKGPPAVGIPRMQGQVDWNMGEINGTGLAGCGHQIPTENRPSGEPPHRDGEAGRAHVCGLHRRPAVSSLAHGTTGVALDMAANCAPAIQQPMQSKGQDNPREA